MNRYLRVAAWQGLEGNLLKSPVLAFFQTFLVLMPVIVPYLAGLGLTMQQILTTQACFSAVIVVMEVPSGYVADRLGRRLALLAGTAFLAAGFLTLWWADSFVDILVFEGLLGVGASMISGADLALLYDTELALGRDGESTTAVANLYTMHAVSEAAAAIACSLLLLLSMRAVIVVQVVAGLVPLLVALTLVEPPVRKDELAMPLRVREVVTHMVGGDPVLRWTVLSLALWPLTTFFAVWILQPQWQAAGVPLHLFGYLWAALMLIAGLAGRWAERLERRLGSARLLLLVGALPVLGFVGLATTPLLATLLFAAGFYVTRGIGSVVLRNALNRRTPSRFRATANSLASFGFRGSFVVAGPLVGGFMDLHGLTATLWLLAGGSLVVSALVLTPLITSIKRQRAVQPAE